MTSKESKIIYLLTGWLPSIERVDKTNPLSATEWSSLARKIYDSELKNPSDLQFKSKDELADILNLNPELSERIPKLLTRSGQVVFELEKYTNQGLDLLTRADANYPKILKKRMKDEMPPWFWYVGNANVLNQSFISVQFPNNKDDSLFGIIKNGIVDIKNNNFSMVLSFNDKYSIEVAEEAIKEDIQVLGVVPFGLTKLTKQSSIRDLLSTKKILFLSQSYPLITKYYKNNGVLQKMVELAISNKIVILNYGKLNEIIYSEIEKCNNDDIYVYNFRNNYKSGNKLSEYSNILDISDIFSTGTVESSSMIIDNAENDNIIYTIGHSNHPIEKFIELLKQHNIEKIVEVRSNAKSSYLPHFNKSNLLYNLDKNGIQYLDRGKYLGGRPEDISVINKDGKILEDKVEDKIWYQDAIIELIKLSKHTRLALMCSEENPLNCHRGYVISHTLLKRGINIEHIRGSGEIDKGKRFVKKELHQVNLFDD